jgi:hypothetical protein
MNVVILKSYDLILSAEPHMTASETRGGHGTMITVLEDNR